MKYILSILLTALAWYSLTEFWHVDISKTSLWDYLAGVFVFCILQFFADFVRE